MQRNKGRFSYSVDNAASKSDKVFSINQADSGGGLSSALELPSARFKYAKWTDLTNIETLTPFFRRARNFLQNLWPKLFNWYTN